MIFFAPHFFAPPVVIVIFEFGYVLGEAANGFTLS